MARDLPYYKLWVKDFDTNENVRMLNLAEAGLFLFALNHAWVNDGLPAADDDVGRVLKLSVRELRAYWPRVSKCFYLADDGRLRNQRQEEERESANKKSKQASEAVAERERKRNERSIERSSSDDLRAYDYDYVSGSSSLFPEAKNPSGPTFEDFWAVWWNRSAKQSAKSAWKTSASTYGTEFLIAACVEDRKRFEQTEDWQWRVKLHAATWLRGKRWEDMPTAVAPSKRVNGVARPPREQPVKPTREQELDALRWIAENDPDPAVREDAKRRLA